MVPSAELNVHEFVYTILFIWASFVKQPRKKAGPAKPARGGGAAAAARLNFNDAVEETLRDERFSASAVFDRIRETLGCESDAALAWVFGTSPQNISNRRKRNSVPYREAIYVALWAKASLEYILTGVGKADGTS
jgi:hypothetical protein